MKNSICFAIVTLLFTFGFNIEASSLSPDDGKDKTPITLIQKIVTGKYPYATDSINEFSNVLKKQSEPSEFFDRVLMEYDKKSYGFFVPMIFRKAVSYKNWYLANISLGICLSKNLTLLHQKFSEYPVQPQQIYEGVLLPCVLYKKHDNLMYFFLSPHYTKEEEFKSLWSLANNDSKHGIKVFEAILSRDRAGYPWIHIKKSMQKVILKKAFGRISFTDKILGKFPGDINDEEFRKALVEHRKKLRNTCFLIVMIIVVTGFSWIRKAPSSSS